MAGKLIVVARVSWPERMRRVRREDFHHIGKHTLASEEASYKIGAAVSGNHGLQTGCQRAMSTTADGK